MDLGLRAQRADPDPADLQRSVGTVRHSGGEFAAAARQGRSLNCPALSVPQSARVGVGLKPTSIWVCLVLKLEPEPPPKKKEERGAFGFCRYVSLESHKTRVTIQQRYFQLLENSVLFPLLVSKGIGLELMDGQVTLSCWFGFGYKRS